jgi:toxin ParE1/3/4
VRVRLTPQAVADLEHARDHYAAIDLALGERFLDDVDAAIGRLTMFPAGAPPVSGFDNLRRARMRRFPYGIFYRESPTEEVIVVRALHTSSDRQRTLAD